MKADLLAVKYYVWRRGGFGTCGALILRDFLKIGAVKIAKNATLKGRVYNLCTKRRGFAFPRTVVPGVTLLAYGCNPILSPSCGSFLRSFELVFDRDWEFTQESIKNSQDLDLIVEGQTFLQPGMSDESNNWGNRGLLLYNYRQLRATLEGLIGPDHQF